MIDLDILTARVRDQLKVDEGYRDRPYKDSRGYLTIGYGWCLDTSPMRRIEADFRLGNDISEAISECIESIPWFQEIGTVRQVVLVNMAFNLGIRGLLRFVKMLEALSHGQNQIAAGEMRNSMYAGQVGQRAERLALMLETGQWPAQE